jgi:outer membrane protein assembly factor BamD
MCSVKQIYSASRDQGQTRVAIDDFAEIDKRWPSSGYGRAARQFLGKGQDVLAEHEFVVGTFYRSKKAYAAATERYKHLLETYPTYRSKDKVYYWLGWTLTHASEPAAGRVWLDQVMTEYPRSKFAAMAQRLLAAEAKEDSKKKPA